MMGVCLEKDAVIQDSLSSQGDIMPTSSTAKLRAANKRVSLPGKAAKDAGKTLASARGVQESRIRDKDSSPSKDADAIDGGDNEDAIPAVSPASEHSNGTYASVEGILCSDAEPPLTDMPTDISKTDDSKIEHPGENLDADSKVEEVMGNSASSKLKAGKNGSFEKTAKEQEPLKSVSDAPLNMVASKVQTERSAQEAVVLTEVVASFKMPNIPDLTKPAPDFCGQAVVDGQFKEIKLSDYKGKYLVLFFYPLDFTFVCPTEIISFSDRVDDFRKVNCEIIACSTDSQYSHFAWVNTSRKQGGLGALNIPLLADKTGQIAKDYGCFKEDEGIAFRGLYIIDDKGRLRQITINDLPVGRSVDETLRLVQAFQFTDKHGEVCPAGWKPGEKTMKPDPTGSKEYFQDAH